MAGDLNFTAKLTTKEFSRGLKDMDRETAAVATKQKRWQEEVSRGFQKGFGGWEKVGRGIWLGVAASVPLAIKAMKEYAEINSVAKAELGGLSLEVRKLFQDIGRDMSFAGVGGITVYVKQLREAREQTATFWGTVGALFTQPGGWESAKKQVKDADDAKRAQEQQDLEIVNKSRLRELKLQLDLNAAERSGDTAAAERIARLKMQEQLYRSIADVGNSPEKSELLSRIDKEPLPSRGGVGGYLGRGAIVEGLGLTAPASPYRELPSAAMNWMGKIKGDTSWTKPNPLGNTSWAQPNPNGRFYKARPPYYGPVGGEMYYAGSSTAANSSRPSAEVPLLQKHFEQNQEIIRILNRIEKKPSASSFN